MPGRGAEDQSIECHTSDLVDTEEKFLVLGASGVARTIDCHELTRSLLEMFATPRLIARTYGCVWCLVAFIEVLWRVIYLGANGSGCGLV